MNKSAIHQYFSGELLAWFDANRRDLPWRRNKNAYYIWISEIMLQQTQVKTVIPYFERFIERFPTIEALAEADEEEVLKYWEGLGYYSRARNLHTAVREVRASYGSVVPSEPEEIRKLKGVGPYTAGAILSIAYNKPEPAVDGNVMRVLSRFFLIEDDIAQNKTRVKMEKLVRELIPHERAGDFNEALMEFGALVCTPKSPQCEACPLEERCAARAEGVELALPNKKKAKPPRLERRVVAIVEGSGENEGKILIRQRPQEGLLARMWELPHVEISNVVREGIDGAAAEAEADAAAAGNGSSGGGDGNGAGYSTHVEQLDRYLVEQIGGQMTSATFFTNISHVFSHIRWEMSAYLCKLSGNVDGGKELELDLVDSTTTYRWITLDERDSYPFPNVFIRLMEQYEQSAWVYVGDDNVDVDVDVD